MLNVVWSFINIYLNKGFVWKYFWYWWIFSLEIFFIFGMVKSKYKCLLCKVVLKNLFNYWNENLYDLCKSVYGN